jgi:hypothetical protein
MLPFPVKIPGEVQNGERMKVQGNRNRWKSQYRVPAPIQLRSFLCDLVVSKERLEWIESRERKYPHTPLINAFAGASGSGGRRGIAQPFHGQGVSIRGRNGVFIDGNKKRAIVTFPEGTEVVDRADIDDIQYPVAPRTKPKRFIDEDGDIHDQSGPGGGCIWKSSARVDAEEVTYSWAPSWAKSSGSWSPLHARDLYQRKHHDELIRRLCGDLHRCNFKELLPENLEAKAAA